MNNVNTASYIIYRDAVNVYAVNGITGNIDKSGVDASTVIQSAINALTNGGLIFIKAGTYTINTGLTIPGGRKIILQGESKDVTKLYTTQPNLLIVGDNITKTLGFGLKDMTFSSTDAGSSTTDLLTIRNSFLVTIENCFFYGFKNGIIFDAYGTNQTGYSYYNLVLNCGLYAGYATGPEYVAGSVGIKFTGPNTSWTSNSNQIIGGYIIYCDKGIYFDKGDTNTVIGTDLTGCNIGVYLDYAIFNKFFGARMEGNKTYDVQFTSQASDNIFMACSFASAPSISDLGARNKFWNCYNYKTENSGSGIGTGIQQAIAHKLATKPTKIALTNKSSTANAFISKNADTIYIYVTAANNQGFLWKVEV